MGLSYRGVGANAKLSPERRYRMRELATQKLAMAYRLDEVAASVATMQSASTLDSVASLVLQRAPDNTDAKYVHFFHEKIPSRMMAEYTPLTPLNEVIAYEPGHAAPFRTRALTKIFKEDHVGAIQDLTEALALCRLDQAKHQIGKSQLVSMKDIRDDGDKRKIWTRDWMEENKVADDDQPSGLEGQLLFQRGNQYLTMACKYIRIALASFEAAERERSSRLNGYGDGDAEEPQCATSTEMEAYQRALEAREALRKYAKRALRDYTAFFAQLDYAYTPTQHADETFHKHDLPKDRSSVSLTSSRLVELDGEADEVTQQLCSTSLTRGTCSDTRNGWSPSPVPPPSVHEISTVLSASPPPGMPPFPAPSSTPLVLAGSTTASPTTAGSPYTEILTYHPFLPETLHAFLLTHCLLQTAPTTLHRLACNVARLARLADGYPFFLAARSPARADWAEILRKTNNWIGLPGSWETLCQPPTPADETGWRTAARNDADLRSLVPVARKGKGDRAMPSLTVQQEDDLRARRREKIRKEAVMEALGDERVVDDATFQRAVEARERRALLDLEMDEKCKAGGNGVSGVAAAALDPAPAQTVKAESPVDPATRKDEKRSDEKGTKTAKEKNSSMGKKHNNNGVAKDEEYLIGTERAEGIARWIMQAPVVVEGGATRARKGRKKTRAPEGGTAIAT